MEISVAKTIHLESLGSLKHYNDLILIIMMNKKQWRKCSNTLNTVRRILHPYGHIDEENQKKSAIEYVTQSLKDLVLPVDVKEAIRVGLKSEFGFII